MIWQIVIILEEKEEINQILSEVFGGSQCLLHWALFQVLDQIPS